MSVNFQDEKEVKEYLDTIGIEYRFGCYSEKKPDGKEERALDRIIAHFTKNLTPNIAYFSIEIQCAICSATTWKPSTGISTKHAEYTNRHVMIMAMRNRV